MEFILLQHVDLSFSKNPLTFNRSKYVCLMKLSPSLILATAFLLMVGFSACTKQYTCECTISYSGMPGLPPTVTKEYSITDTKDNAKSLCTKNSSTYDSAGVHTVETCYLY
jgi:hypothetical protein